MYLGIVTEQKQHVIYLFMVLMYYYYSYAYVKILCSFFGVTLFQTPYFWPTQKWVAEDTDYGEHISLSAGLFFLKTAKY